MKIGFQHILSALLLVGADRATGQSARPVCAGNGRNALSAPPAAITLPFASRVVVNHERREFMVPVGAQVPATGS